MFSLKAAAVLATGSTAIVLALPTLDASIVYEPMLAPVSKKRPWSHWGLLPQGQPERTQRVRRMVEAMDAAGFGNCSNQYACEAVCPKEISASWIARMNRDFVLSRRPACLPDKSQPMNSPPADRASELFLPDLRSWRSRP